MVRGWPTDADIERARNAALEKVGLEDECPRCGGCGVIEVGRTELMNIREVDECPAMAAEIAKTIRQGS